MQKATHIGKCTESLNGLLVKLSSKAVESVLVDVLGLQLEAAQGIADHRRHAALFELDNVLVGNEVVLLSTRRQDGSGLRARGRRRQCQRQECEERCHTHGEDVISSEGLQKRLSCLRRGLGLC